MLVLQLDLLLVGFHFHDPCLSSACWHRSCLFARKVVAEMMKMLVLDVDLLTGFHFHRPTLSFVLDHLVGFYMALAPPLLGRLAEC